MTRVFLAGASGTIGQATAAALQARGHDLTCFVRPSSQVQLPGQVLRGELDSLPDLTGYDAVVSCLASRTGSPEEAWRIDHHAHLALLDRAERAGVRHFVQLSAICVQKPRLAFQHAKLAFEEALVDADLAYSIVRPTAYFKSLSGQLERVRAGKPYLMFGDGQRTACKPISDRDLGDYIADCLTRPERWDRVLPIGGPGPAMTPRMVGEMLFRVTGKPPKFRSVPLHMLKWIASGLSVLGRKEKAEFARIGHYYATESMLVWDGARYDVAGTPETGQDQLEHYLTALARGEIADQRGDHALF